VSVPGPLGATPQGGAVDLRARALGSRSTAAPATVGIVALGGLVLCGLVIAVAAAGTDNLLPESVRPIPSWLAGPLGSAGLDLGAGGVSVVLALMFGCYVLTVRDAGRLPARTVLMGIAAVHALILLAPPLLSTDIFSYSAYGRMGALYGADPYLHGPSAIQFDTLYPYVGAKWVTTPTAYGPAFTVLSYVLAPLSIAAGVLAYKAAAALASLATVTLVWHAAKLRGVNQAKAVALVGLNPLIIVYGMGGGHNDLLMVTALVAGVYALLAQRGRASGGLLVLAAGIKVTAGVLLPFAVAGAAGRRLAGRRRDLLVGAGIAAVGLAGASAALFGTGPLHLVSTVQQSQSEGDWHSIPSFISSLLGFGTIGHLTGILLALGFVATAAWLVRRVWRGQLDWIAGAGWATVAMLVTASSLLPWYVAWLIPLAALGGDPRLWKAALYVTGVVQLIQIIGYIPHVSSTLGL
jgi:alpha-1,6-mannosyltransferase